VAQVGEPSGTAWVNLGGGFKTKRQGYGWIVVDVHGRVKGSTELLLEARALVIAMRRQVGEEEFLPFGAAWLERLTRGG
jgi:hypothetical protein